MYNTERITDINSEIDKLLDKVKKLRQEKLNLEQENLNKHINIGDYVKILYDDECLDARYMLVNEIDQSDNTLKIIGPSFSYFLIKDDSNCGENYFNVDDCAYEYIETQDLEDGIITVVSKEEFETTYNEMSKKVFSTLFNK